MFFCLPHGPFYGHDSRRPDRLGQKRIRRNQPVGSHSFCWDGTSMSFIPYASLNDHVTRLPRDSLDLYHRSDVPDVGQDLLHDVPRHVRDAAGSQIDSVMRCCSGVLTGCFTLLYYSDAVDGHHCSHRIFTINLLMFTIQRRLSDSM